MRNDEWFYVGSYFNAIRTGLIPDQHILAYYRNRLKNMAYISYDSKDDIGKDMPQHMRQVQEHPSEEADL